MMSSSGAGNLATRNETPLAGERVHGTNRKTRTKTDADDSEKNRHSSVLFIVEPNSRRKRKIYEKVRTMTLNIQTCSDKYEDRLDEICQLGSRKKLSIMVLTEFRRRGLDSREVRLEDGTTWDVYWTGFKSKREYGVAICLKRERKLEFLGRSSAAESSERLMWVDIRLCGINIRVFAAYAPTNCPDTKGNPAARATFWRNLKALAADLPSKTEALYLGDFNSTTTLVRPMEHTNFGKEKDYNVDFTCNENGEQLTSFCAENGLALLNSFFTHKKSHLLTHISNSNNENANKTLDYCLSTQMMARFCHDCQVKPGYLNETSISSDHRCLIQRWRIPLRKRDRQPKKKKKKPSPDLAALRDQPKLLEEYEKKLEDLATILENDDSDMNLDLRAQKLTDSMNKIARELLPKKVPTRLDLPWRNDLEILSLKSQRNNLKNCQNDKAEFRRLSTLIKKRANALRSEFYLKQAEGINLAAQSRDLEKLFRRATNHDAFNQAAAPPAARADFRGHFGRHFNKQHPESSPQELDEMPDYLIKALDDALDPLLPDILIAEPPTQDEVTAAIKGLKARKASEDVAPELLKAALECPSFMAHLTDLYGEIWGKKSIPLHWRYARLKALYKNKGKADDAGNYRGISVGSTQLKVLCVIILTRMREWYEGNLSEGQYGFRAKRGCQDAIYGLKRVQQIYHH